MSDMADITVSRLRWAMLRAGYPTGPGSIWETDGISMEEARSLAAMANVPMASLFLPDPSRWQLFKALLYGFSVRPGE